MPRWRTFIWLFPLALALPSAGVAQSGPGVAPAGWNTYGPGFAAAPDCPPPIQPASGMGSTTYEQIPDDTGWLYENMPIERFVKETFRHFYFRTEYLNWSITDPGNNVLGGPTNYPTFLYPPDLIRNPTNPAQFIPASIYSVGLSPTTLTNQNNNNNNGTTTNFSFDGGAQRSTLPPVYHITNPALTVDPTNGTPEMYVATQPTMQGVTGHSNNGIRTTFGFQLNDGTVEASIFALKNRKNTFAPQQVQFLDFADVDFNTNTTEYLPTFDAVAQAITINGQAPTQPIAVTINEVQTPANPQLPIPVAPNPLPANYPLLSQPLLRGDNLRIVYNPVMDPVTGQVVATNGITNPTTGNRLVPVYQAVLNTQVWGSESNYIAPYYDEGSEIHIQPMFGIRYLNFSESLRQSGLYTFTQLDTTTNLATQTVVGRQINSSTINNLYGPQIGMRGEYTHKWFTLGAQPKFMMGVNSYKANLNTFQVLRPDDANQDINVYKNNIGLVGDLQVYSRLKLTNCFHVFVAYNMLWTGPITRPSDNIVYNATTLPGVTTPTSENDLQSNFKLNPQYSGAILQGVSVGGELRF